MSANAHDTLHIIAAVVIYRDRGIVEALAYLKTEAGYTSDEALDLLVMVDNMTDAVKRGTLG